MAQTTDGISSVNALVEYSELGVTYTDISGFSTTVEPKLGARKIGEANTHEGDTPIVTYGKRESSEAVVRFIYTKGASDPFTVFRGYWEASTDFSVRWSEAGGASGDLQHVIRGQIIEFYYPNVPADSPDPLVAGFKMKINGITTSVVTP